MKTPKAIHYLALACLAFYIAKRISFSANYITTKEMISIGIWLSLLIMLFKRPRNWGLGIGIFMLTSIVIQFGLWRLMLNIPEREKLGINDSILFFTLSVLPLFVGGVCSIILRYIYPKSPEYPPNRNETH